MMNQKKKLSHAKTRYGIQHAEYRISLTNTSVHPVLVHQVPPGFRCSRPRASEEGGARVPDSNGTPGAPDTANTGFASDSRGNSRHTQTPVTVTPANPRMFGSVPTFSGSRRAFSPVVVCEAP